MFNLKAVISTVRLRSEGDALDEVFVRARHNERVCSMLTIFGRAQREALCDGISRRGFLQIGSLALFGGSGTLTLADLFRAEARTGTASKHKAVINIFLGGGPPHQDMWDIKTEAPAEIRGEFKPIATNVPGLQICEVFPQLAARMDKCAVIRSSSAPAAATTPCQCMSGWRHKIAGRDGRPAEPRRRPSPASRARSIRSVPPFVGLAARDAHALVRLRHARLSWVHPTARSSPTAPAWPTSPSGNITLDAARRPPPPAWPASTACAATSTPTAAYPRLPTPSPSRAFGVLTSSRLLEALDLSKESEKVRDATATASRTTSSTTAPRPSTTSC